VKHVNCSILNRLGYRTATATLDGEARATCPPYNGFPACPPQISGCGSPCNKPLATLRVSEMVVRRLIAQESSAKQIVKFAPWMIERSHLDLPSVRKEIRRVHEGPTYRMGG